MTLYYLNYNNYYNRIVKRETSLSAYRAYAMNTAYDIDFNPNDDISTELIVDDYFDDSTPNYLIVAEGNEIISRWFIIEAIRTRAGQYKVSLKRDVVVDWYDQLLESPFLAERCTIDDDDPYIFNDEGIGFNQIKKNSTLLKDASKSRWYVGYLAKNLGDYEGKEFKIIPEEADFNVSSWESFDYYAYTSVNPNRMAYRTSGLLQWFGMRMTTLTGSQGNINNYYVNAVNGSYISSNAPPNMDYGDTLSKWNRASDNMLAIGTNFAYVLGQAYPNSDGTIQDAAFNSIKAERGLRDTDPLSAYNGKTIYVANENKYYKLSVTTELASSVEKVSTRNGIAYRLIDDAVKSGRMYTEGWLTENASGTNPYYVLYQYQEMRLEATPWYPQSEYYFELSHTRNHLEDAPYDMFAIPADLSEIKTAPNASVPVLPEVTQEAVSALINQLQVAVGGTGYIYDVQILPYCPIRNFDNSGFTIQGLTEGEDYEWIKTTNGNFREGIILFPKKSSFQFSINTSFSVTNKKIQHLTEFHRLCSPNGASMFEFSAAANNGLSKINVECTYKPFNPYIYLAPEFSGLYGQTFTYEQRGLICSGDFSLPIVTDAWKQYELNNKNFQIMFDRQIQNLDVNRDIQREQQKWGYAAGIVQGAASGINSGALLGTAISPGMGTAIGAIAGGIGGGVASGIAGAKDVQLAERAYAEQRSYQVDIFNSQVGNIKALPNTLTRVGALDINNPIFPILEFYSATDEEKEQLAEYLYWNGMKAGKVGKLKDFKKNFKTFIRGSVLRNEDIVQDSHILNSIIYELSQGVFI